MTNYNTDVFLDLLKRYWKYAVGIGIVVAVILYGCTVVYAGDVLSIHIQEQR
jgi:hypothetical protein